MKSLGQRESNVEKRAYYGLWRGIVIDNNDENAPEGTGSYLSRIKVHIPELHGVDVDEETLPWAWPLQHPWGGGLIQSEEAGELEVESGERSGNVMVPVIGATVGIIFEQGNPEVPVWVGAFPAYVWSGEQGTSELPLQGALVQEVDALVPGTRESSPEVARYPYVYVVKTPWGENIYVRIAKDRLVEFRYGSDRIQFKNLDAASDDVPGAEEPYADMVRKAIHVFTPASNIILESREGKISLMGKKIDILAEEDIRVQAGRFNEDGTVNTRGAMSLVATTEADLHSVRETRVASGTKHVNGEIIGLAKKASGFEDHEETG